MKINEIFYSLQGEGRRAGEASIFIRLSGCDQTCGFCDTEFESGKSMTREQVAGSILETLHRTGLDIPLEGLWIVWTGGEPALQLTAEDVAFFKSLTYRQAIETNGAHPAPAGLDWVCVSPKVAEHVVAKNFPNGVNELRYVRHKGQMAVPSPAIKAEHYFISPIFRGDQPDPENIAHCIKLCLESPQWKLSMQTHKLLKIL